MIVAIMTTATSTHTNYVRNDNKISLHSQHIRAMSDDEHDLHVMRFQITNILLSTGSIHSQCSLFSSLRNATYQNYQIPPRIHSLSWCKCQMMSFLRSINMERMLNNISHTGGIIDCKFLVRRLNVTQNCLQRVWWSQQKICIFPHRRLVSTLHPRSLLCVKTSRLRISCHAILSFCISVKLDVDVLEAYDTR